MGEQGKKSSGDDALSEEQTYELDLDAHSSVTLDSAIEEAVAAVGRESDGRDKAPPSAARPEVIEVGSDNQDDELTRLRAERDRLRDGLQRTLADLDNFRKRTEREKKSLSRFAVSEVVRDFLEVIDNLERAISASGSAEDLKMGLEMVLRQQGDILARHGVEKIDALGEEFDPAVHEAVLRQESADVKSPTVSAELQRGYMHYDRLLRPAMVHVTVPSKPAASDDEVDREETGGN